jgi:hypothetical protein
MAKLLVLWNKIKYVVKYLTIFCNVLKIIGTFKTENKQIGESLMEQSVTMKELKEVMAFAISFGETADVVLADGKVELAELALLMTPIMKLPAAVEGAKLIKAKELSAEDKAELVKFVEEELHLASARTEALIEQGLELAVKVSEYVKLFKKA